MVRCSRRPTRGCRHAVRRSGIPILSAARSSTVVIVLWISRFLPRVDSPRSRRVHACAPVASVKAGRLAARLLRGRLDGRVLRCATLGGVWLGCEDGCLVPSRCATYLGTVFLTYTPSRFRVWGVFLTCASPLATCAFRPRFVGDAHRRRVSDVFDSPEHQRGLSDMFDYSAEGTLQGCASSGFAGRPRAASRAPRSRAARVVARRPGLHGGPTGCKVRNVRAVRRDSEGAASFARHTPWRWACEAKWRRGVGRQARQSGGELLVIISTYRQWLLARGTNQAYPPCTVMRRSRTIGRPVFDSPQDAISAAPVGRPAPLLFH
jgi:hypothetical protein